MRRVYQFLLFTLSPILLLFALGYLYKTAICAFANSSENADLICHLSWKDGFFLFCSYTVVKLLSPVLEFNRIIVRVLVSIGLYIISFGLFGGPFMIASFFQPFFINVFFHSLILIVVIENCFQTLAEKLSYRLKKA